MRLWRAVCKGVDAFVRELQEGKTDMPEAMVPIASQGERMDELKLTNAEREALARKERSEARLRSEGVPFIRHLPRMETRDEVRCLVPAFDGAFLSHDSKDALWDKFYTAAPPRRRQSVEQYKIVKRA